MECKRSGPPFKTKIEISLPYQACFRNSWWRNQKWNTNQILFGKYDLDFNGKNFTLVNKQTACLERSMWDSQRMKQSFNSQKQLYSRCRLLLIIINSWLLKILYIAMEEIPFLWTQLLLVMVTARTTNCIHSRKNQYKSPPQFYLYSHFFAKKSFSSSLVQTAAY
jgi:hypothetical protein